MLLTAVDPAEVDGASVDGTLGMLDKTVDLDTLIERLVGVLEGAAA